MKKQITKVSDLVPDTNNANKHSKRGLEQLEDSLRKYGAGRGIVVDKHGNIISGNATAETCVGIGIEGTRVIETSGNELVVVVRTDLDLYKDKEARELAYADNRTSELDLSWDVNQILADHQAGINMNLFWSNEELHTLIGNAEDDENSQRVKPRNYKVTVKCEDEEDMNKLLEVLKGKGYNASASIR